MTEPEADTSQTLPQKKYLHYKISHSHCKEKVTLKEHVTFEKEIFL